MVELLKGIELELEVVIVRGPPSHAGETISTRQQDVLYVPGNLCYADDATRRKPSHEMRLSFGAAPEADIRRGIQRLGRVIGKN